MKIGWYAEIVNYNYRFLSKILFLSCHCKQFYSYRILIDSDRWSRVAIKHQQQIHADADEQSQFYVENQTSDKRR